MLPVSETRLHGHDHGQQHSWCGHVFVDLLGNSDIKDPDAMLTREKDPDLQPPEDPLSEAFSKSSGWV